MSLVLQYDPRVNVTYAYHNDSRWDKEHKQSSSSRILIGKVDPETGKVVIVLCNIQSFTGTPIRPLASDVTAELWNYFG